MMPTMSKLARRMPMAAMSRRMASSQLSAVALASRTARTTMRRRNDHARWTRRDLSTQSATWFKIGYHTPQFRLTERAVKYAAVIAIVAPCIAVVQGVELLSDYRTNHGDTPVPPMPQQGVVVAEDANARREKQELPPLRLLVIGDSLAAGVGMSKSNTPALPVSIARGISQASGGRVVYWTCVGSPGVSASQIVVDIQNMNQRVADSLLPQNRMEALVREWQAKRKSWRQRQALRRRESQEQEALLSQQEDLQRRMDNPISFESNRHMIRKWWRQVRESQNKMDTTKHFIGGWWGRLRSHVRNEVKHIQDRVKEDIDDITTIVQTPQLNEDDDGDDDDDDENSIAKRPATGVLRKDDIDLVNSQQYDIAVVLTGLNDVKDSYLPSFMVTGRNSSLQEGTERIIGGWKNQFRTIIKVLNPHMVTQIDFQNPKYGPSGEFNEQKQGSGMDASAASSSSPTSSTATALNTRGSCTTHGDHKAAQDPSAFPTFSTEPFFKDETLASSPVVRSKKVADAGARQDLVNEHKMPSVIVFPALPVAPLEMFQMRPLKWFIVPAFEKLDSEKKGLAQQYSDRVLFIEQPPLDFWKEVEAGKGTIFDNLRREKVLLMLNDMAQDARERIESVVNQQKHLWGDQSDPDEAARGSGKAAPSQEQNRDTVRVTHEGSSLKQGRAQEQAQAAASQYAQHSQDPDDHPGCDITTKDGNGDDGDANGCGKGLTGSTLVAVDKMHPNDEGYEIWGRFIASAVVQHWKEQC